MVDEDEAPARMGLHEPGGLGVSGRDTDGRDAKPNGSEQLRPVELARHDGERRRSHTVATRSTTANAKKIPASIAWNVQNCSAG